MVYRSSNPHKQGKKSLLIGDKESDMEAGRRAGIPEEGLILEAP